jgi:hypothetical protein
LFEKEVNPRRMTLYIGHKTDYETLEWIDSRKNRSSEIIEVIQKYVTGEIGNTNEYKKRILKLENKVNKLEREKEVIESKLNEEKDIIKKMLEEALTLKSKEPIEREINVEDKKPENQKETKEENTIEKKEKKPEAIKTKDNLFKGLSNGKQYKSRGKGLNEMP